MLWDRSREDIAPVSSSLVSSPFQSSVIWSGPLLLFLAPTLTSISLFPSPKTVVPSGLSLPVLVPSLASPVMLTPPFLKCQIKCPPSFSKHSDALSPAQHLSEGSPLAPYFSPRFWGGAEMFAEWGWREGWQICGPLHLPHPRNTERSYGAPYPDDKH